MCLIVQRGLVSRTTPVRDWRGSIAEWSARKFELQNRIMFQLITLFRLLIYIYFFLLCWSGLCCGYPLHEPFVPKITPLLNVLYFKCIYCNEAPRCVPIVIKKYTRLVISSAVRVHRMVIRTSIHRKPFPMIDRSPLLISSSYLANIMLWDGRVTQSKPDGHPGRFFLRFVPAETGIVTFTGYVNGNEFCQNIRLGFVDRKKIKPPSETVTRNLRMSSKHLTAATSRVGSTSSQPKVESFEGCFN
jgi:hypothetical protein